MNNNLIKQSFTQTLRNLSRVIPIIIGVFLLLALFETVIPKSIYIKFFTNIPLVDAFIGAGFGSISAGNPITSYIIGGELLKHNINLTAVIAFILSWVTVGFIQIPTEVTSLGKKFAIVHNSINFIFAIIIALMVTLTLKLL